ncbi:mucin-binding protein [Lactobacillus crispatus]|uniref:Mucus-binding protein n=1 Tax=Lactobacillus crispatus TaxID=47770 RepID=A0AAW4DQ31_9LACO|nr:YSIRK-type signal peptide-containing protein [Lactobacillus crispatus]MBI1707893.1 mucus-binding protein [Lactobacillus crispatus]
MLFNKHAETKQRFGIRKLTIGATSVLLSTLFLTINNSQKAQAATAENGSSTTSSLEQKDSKSTSNQNVTDPSAGNTQNSSPNQNRGGTADTTNGVEKTSATSDTAENTAKNTATTDLDGKTANEAAINKEVTDKPLKDDGQDKAAVEKVAAANMKFAAKPPASPSTPVLSQDSHDKNMSLSINSAELSNKTYDPEVITLNATNVHAGDKIVIKVKKGSAYDLKGENLPVGTVTFHDKDDYRVYELNITATGGKLAYKIIATKYNNYWGQPAPMPDTGVTNKDIQWSVNGQDQAPLSFKQTIIPQLTADTVYIANSYGAGYGAVSSTIKKVIPNQDYNFVYKMTENNGIIHDGSYASNNIHSAVNYGSTITIPVPENFLLNHDTTIKANTELGLIDKGNADSQITITQAGIGQDIIITVPKGRSKQGADGQQPYVLNGKFVYDQNNLPEHDTTVEAKGNSVIDQTYTADGQKIQATGGVFKVTIAGKDYKPQSGDLNLGVGGAVNNNELLLDSNPTNDPKVVNWFTYNNNSNGITDAKIQLDLADGLHVTGIKTPKDLGTIYNNIGNIKSYTYEITLTNGKKVTGTVTAGETVSSTDNVGIRSIIFTPDTKTIGRNTKTDGLPNVGKISDQTANLSQNLFIAYGNLNDTYDDGTKVKVDDKLTSSITIFGSNFKSKPDGTKVVSYTASGTQTIIDSSKFTASLGTWTYQPSTNPGQQSAGEISLNGGGSGNYSYIYEPIFYYVVPGNAVFSGNSVDRLNKNGNQSPSPIVTSYLVNGHQIVKVDYTGTNYQYNTATGANDSLHLDNANNQTGKTLPWEVYIYSKDIKIVTSGAKGQFLTASDAEKSGSSLKLDPNKFYYIGGGNWTTATASAMVMADSANGNKNNGLYFQQASSDDKGTNQMSFRVNVVNYDTQSDLRDAVGFVNLPTIGYNNSTLNFSLSGPVDANDQTVLYSTTTTDLPTDLHTKTPSTDNFLTEDQVKEKIAKGEMSWSDIKSIAIKYDTVKANTATKDIYIHGIDKNIAQDAGKVGKLAWGLYGGNGMPPLVNKNASKITVSGTSTIDVRLHYKDPDKKDQYINVPSMSKTYKDNDNDHPMNESDFSQYSIPTELIPKGYELVLKDGQAVKSIINNGGKTWTTDAPDGSAQFGKTVIYNFDHDTVQFELTPKIDKATQSIKHVVHFVTNDSSAHQLFDDQAVDVTVTQATNEVTGKKTYAASYMENGKEVSLSVTKLDDGQISITFPAATIPSSKEYYVVDNTEDQANALTHTFTFTANSNSTIENFIKYAPVKQKLQVQVYDDDSKTALDTKDTGAKIEFIGNSNAAFPTNLQTNLDKLKTYYEGKNYIVTLPSASGNFDDTDNGPDKDKKVQVIEVHLTHAKDVKTEQVNAVRNVTYSGAGDLTPAEKTDTAQNVFSRTVTTDKVTNEVTKSQWTGSHTFAGVATPAVSGYHADKALAGNIEVTADSLNKADTATLAELMKNGVVVSDHVTYAPDHQELKIRVHDDTTNQDLSPVTAQSDLKDTIAISADGHTDEATPADFSNNIDKLKKYYKSKGYEIVSTSEVPAKFDNTSNGTSTTDKTPQYVDIHLEHALKLEKESKEITRTINFYDQDQNKLIHDANPNLPQYQQTVTQIVKFDRYIVRDEVTGQIIGYATPSQVTVDSTGQAQLVQKDGYTHATGESSDKTAGFVSPANYDKYNSYNNYDLSRYGYEAPTDVDGNSYSQVAAATPKATDSDSVVNVYYHEKVVTVTVDNPPTPGTPIVPGSDVRYPKNDWNKQTATSESTRIIHYIYDDNTFVNGKDVSRQPVPGLDDIKQTVTFTQSAKINLVTGVVSYQGDWKPKDSSIYAEVVSPNYKTNPSLTGYTPHQEIVNAAKATYGANAGDVFVRYVANNSLVQVEYVDKDTGDTLKVDKKTGKSGETFTYSTADLIKEYEKQGYELDHDGYTLNDGHLNQLTFDSYDDVTYGQYPAEIKQKWTVYLTHKKLTVTSDQPKDSTEKITTSHGYDHNYPSGVGQNDLNNTVKRTISFVYTDKPDGPFPFPSVEQDVSYRRKATIDLVKLAKGDKDAVTYSNWEPAEAGKESFTKNPVPVKTSYVADYEVVPSQDVPKDKTGKAENGQNVVVKYSPVGKIIPVDKEGNTIPGAPTPSYSNDSHDPTKVTNTPVPEIPGYHAEISEVTPNPNKPVENTKVVYVKNKQTIDLTYVDTTTNKTLTTQANVAQGDSDSAIPASVTDTLNATTQSYLDKGYVIDASKPQATVPTNFDSSSQNPDGTDAEHQVVTVYLTHGKETITANDPKNPGDPINEKDPNGAKYPPEASKSNLTISSQNIVHYKGAGEQTPKDSVVTDDNTLTRTVTIDKVTGDVLPETSAWQGEKDYDDVATPVVTGYFADKKTAGESKATTADVERAKDGVITNETTVVYKPMGKIIPVDKNGNPIPNSPRPIFNNDPQDPTKASKTNTPEIPGYHTEISEVTPDPDNPGKDREVVYVADSQKVLIQVYDKDSKTPNQPLDTSKTNVTVSFNGDSFTNFPTSAATSVDDLIKYCESCGYKVENKPTAEELAAKFDGDKTVDQYLKLTLVHDTETITGENPKKVGDPINPADPDSKKYGEQTSKENLVIASEVTIDYDGAGKKTPTKSVRTNDRALTRSVTIDKVTGAVISTSDWTGGANYDAVTTPKIPGYTADLESAGKASITPADYNDAVNGVITRKFKVVYTPEKQELQLKIYDQDLDKYLGGTDSFYGWTDQEVGEDPQTRLDELKKQFAEWGFDIVEVPKLAKNYDNTENGTSDQDNKSQVFVLVVKHHIETVTPDDPKTPEDKIPNTNQNYPSGLTETDLSKTITRTIIVHMPDGSTKEIKQEVVYTRTATVDSVTKEVTYTDWTSKNSNWSEYQSPDIPGYTVDIEKVELAKVPVDGHDVTVEINYTADPVPDEPVNPSNPGNPGTTTPDQPQQPGKPTDPTKPSEPNKPSNPGRPTNPNHPTKPTKPVTPAKPDQTHDQHSKVNGETDLNGFVDGISDEKAGAVAGASDNAQAGAKKLPQTSGESGWQASLLGMGLFFISLFGFKKKKEDE